MVSVDVKHHVYLLTYKRVGVPVAARLVQTEQYSREAVRDAVNSFYPLK